MYRRCSSYWIMVMILILSVHLILDYMNLKCAQFTVVIYSINPVTLLKEKPFAVQLRASDAANQAALHTKLAAVIQRCQCLSSTLTFVSCCSQGCHTAIDIQAYILSRVDRLLEGKKSAFSCSWVESLSTAVHLLCKLISIRTVQYIIYVMMLLFICWICHNYKHIWSVQ